MVFNKDLSKIPTDGTTEKDILIEIPNEKVGQFCETLKADWPLSIHAYYFIKTMSEWRVKRPAIQCQLLCVDPDDNLGTFVGILQSDAGNVCIILYTLEEDNKQLQNALVKTSKIKWDANPMFEGILTRHSTCVESAIRLKGKTPDLYANSTLYYMSSENASSIDINVPDNVYIADLNTKNIDYMYSVWAHNDIYSKQELLDAVTFNCGVGLYSKDDDTLLSWVVHTHYGGLGNLQTRNGEEGKGYGKLITCYLSKKLGQLGYDLHATIRKVNLKSRGLFSSIGFDFRTRITYIVAK